MEGLRARARDDISPHFGGGSGLKQSGNGGEAGVDYAVSLLAEEMSRTMALIGCTSVGQIGRAHVAPARHPA